MKRGFLTIVVFIVVSIMVDAQAVSLTGSQIKQEAQQYLQEVRTNSSQFDSTMVDQTTRDINNKNMITLSRLRAETERLAASINAEQGRIDGDLSRGQRANQSSIKRVQQLIDRYKERMAELEAFVDRIEAT